MFDLKTGSKVKHHCMWWPVALVTHYKTRHLLIYCNPVVVDLQYKIQLVLRQTETYEVFCVSGLLHNRACLVEPRAEKTGGQSSFCCRWRRWRHLTGLLSSLNTDVDVTKQYTYMHTQICTYTSSVRQAYVDQQPQRYDPRRRTWQRLRAYPIIFLENHLVWMSGPQRDFSSTTQERTQEMSVWYETCFFNPVTE